MCSRTTETTKKPGSCWIQRRYLVNILAFFGFLNINSLRVNMSIGIVAMISDRLVTLENGTIINIGPEFAWDNTLQGYVLSAFFYGYAFTQILGGLLGKKYGGKLVFGGAIGTTAFLTALSPWFNDLSVYVFLVSRIIMGAFEGMAVSGIFSLFTKWAPPKERSRIASQAVSGGYFGTVFSMIFLAYLAESTSWRSIFWFSGGLALLWFAAWTYFVYESPENDPKISKEELHYIQSSIQDSQPIGSEKIQWKALLTSQAVWAYNAGMFCEVWGYTTLLTLLPKFFKDIFDFDLSKSGILSALPYLAMGLMMQVSGHVSDRIAIKKWLTITQTRKAFMILGFLSQTVFILGAAFWGNAGGTVFCLVMAVGLGALSMTVLSVNTLDIAPIHSGIIYGQAQTLATIPGIVSPVIAGYIISTENPTVYQWRIVFYIAAGFYFLGAMFYGLFGSGTRQSWDMVDTNKNTLALSAETLNS